MKSMHYFPELKDEGEAVAYFGGARLIKRLDGTLELIGGSDADRATAQDWMFKFMHKGDPGNMNTA